MDPMTIIWLVAMVVFVVIEAATPQLVCIWLAGGCLVAVIVSFFSPAVWLQLLCFVAVSAVLLACTRPLARRMRDRKTTPTNADQSVGKLAVVTEAIDNLAGRGLVNLSGQVWTARSAHSDPIAQGEQVRVIRIEGVKLIVEPEEHNE